MCYQCDFRIGPANTSPGRSVNHLHRVPNPSDHRDNCSISPIGNFIDTSGNYQFTQSEQWLGQWLKKRGVRDQMGKFSLKCPDSVLLIHSHPWFHSLGHQVLDELGRGAQCASHHGQLCRQWLKEPEAGR